MYEYDYTDITRKGDAIINKPKVNPMYSRYQPLTLSDEKDEKRQIDPETEEIKNMGLGKYLRLLSEEKINDNTISPEELDALRSLSRKYQDKIHYVGGDYDDETDERKIQNDPQSDPGSERKEEFSRYRPMSFGEDKSREKEDRKEYEPKEKEDRKEKEPSLNEDESRQKKDKPEREPSPKEFRKKQRLSSNEDLDDSYKTHLKSPPSSMKSKGKSRKSKKKVSYSTTPQSNKTRSFVPTQTRDPRDHVTDFDIERISEKHESHQENTPDKKGYYNFQSPSHHYEEEENYEETEECDYKTTKSYYLDDGTLYFTSGKFYLNEMSARVERHHKETVRNPEKTEFVKPYLNKVHGSYYTGKNLQRAYYSPKTISNQEFIDRAYYDVCVRGYLRNRKRYKVSYPLYGENLHGAKSSNKVIIHDPRNTRGTFYSSRRSVDALNA